MNDTESWLLEYLRISPNGGEELTENYFERGVIDSLGIVQLVVEIEERFGIRLESGHLQDQRFCTVRGLAQIVDEAKAA
jgi:acyl carrier protein